MSRFVDAEHFDQRVRIAGGMSEDELTEDFKDGVLATLALLKTEPTADVVEVVHGEWIKMDKRGNNVRCSKCGNTLDLRGVNAGRGDANYCPNCGAYMRGEDDAEIH